MADEGPTEALAEVRWHHIFGYALGGGGWVMLDRLILTYGLFFYRPPDDSAFVQRLPDGLILGVFTAWSLASLLGRVIDSITDPLMAFWTDNNRSAFGRRRVFMAAAFIPLCIFTGLVFNPPVDGADALNSGWVFFVLFGFYLTFTIYAVPYTAMIAELGRTPPVRLKVTIGQAVMQMVGAGLVLVCAPVLFDMFEDGDPWAFRSMGIAFGVIGFVFLLGPILLVPEPRVCPHPGPPKKLESIRELFREAFGSLFSVLQSTQLRWFLLATVSYWFGFNIVAQGVGYFVTILMEQTESFITVVMGILFGVSFIGFPLLFPAAKRFGKRRLMIFGAASMAVLMFLIPFINDVTTGLILMGVAGVPVAIVMAVPNAMLAALAEEDAAASGVKREAMVFATQAFFLKVNLGVSAFAFDSMLNLGKSVANPLGVQIAGPVGGVVLLVSAFAYWKFKDPDEALLAAHKAPPTPG